MPELSRFFGIIIRMFMKHLIYRVLSFKSVAPFTLKIEFDDNTSRVVDFQPILKGEMYAPLQELEFFNQVKIDPEVHTLVWTNGADFDPATLHDWPQYAQEIEQRAEQWA